MKEIIKSKIGFASDYVCNKYPEAIGIAYWMLDNDLLMLFGVSERAKLVGDMVIWDLLDKKMDKGRVKQVVKLLEDPTPAMEKAINQGLSFPNWKASSNRLKRSICHKVFGADIETVVNEPEG